MIDRVPTADGHLDRYRCLNCASSRLADEPASVSGHGSGRNQTQLLRLRLAQHWKSVTIRRMLIKGTQATIIRDGDLPGPHGFTWGFIGLEYYGLILNRVMAVLFSTRSVTIVRVGDVVAAPHHVTDAHYDPLAYVGPRMAAKYSSVAVESDEVLRIDRVNRRVPLSEVRSVTFEDSAKWGMGSVPYSGKIFLHATGRPREFVLLGNQSGEKIVAHLSKTLPAA